MWLWWLMLCCGMMIPLAMILCGWMMWKHCPKQINGLVGYRTTRSMKNIDTWTFANHYCGKLWWKLGWRILVPSVLVFLPVSTELAIVLVSLSLTAIQAGILAISIFLTEKALKEIAAE